MKKKKEALCLLFEISPAYQYHADQADDTDEAIEVPFVRYVSIQVVHAEVLYSENDYGYDNQYSA
jgi:carotenoid cleavage dioxygenase-like enzyme